MDTETYIFPTPYNGKSLFFYSEISIQWIRILNPAKYTIFFPSKFSFMPTTTVKPAFNRHLNISQRKGHFECPLKTGFTTCILSKTKMQF